MVLNEGGAGTDDNEKEKERIREKKKKSQIGLGEIADSKDSWLLPRRPSFSRSGENKVKGREEERCD
jgi:hypothetical protein